MRTSGSHLLVLGEFRRSLFDGAAESRVSFLHLLDAGITAPEFLVEPSTGPKNIIKDKIEPQWLLVHYQRFSCM